MGTMATETIIGPVETSIEGLEDLIPYEDDGDDTRKTHVIRQHENDHLWSPGMTGKDILDLARMTGEFVIALCGFKFVPNHNPEKYDACATCIDLAGKIMMEEG